MAITWQQLIQGLYIKYIYIQWSWCCGYASYPLGRDILDAGGGQAYNLICEQMNLDYVYYFDINFNEELLFMENYYEGSTTPVALYYWLLDTFGDIQRVPYKKDPSYKKSIDLKK